MSTYGKGKYGSGTYGSLYDGVLTDEDLLAILNALRQEFQVELSRLDASISSRLASISYIAPPTPNNIADSVWNADSTDYNTVDTMGKNLNNIKTNTNLIPAAL